MKTRLIECNPNVLIGLGIHSVETKEYIWGEKEVKIVDATKYNEYVMLFNENNYWKEDKLHVLYKGNEYGELVIVSLNESRKIREYYECGFSATYTIEFGGDEHDQFFRIGWTVDSISHSSLDEFKLPKLYLVKYEHD